jgi:hypothetical protein
VDHQANRATSAPSLALAALLRLNRSLAWVAGTLRRAQQLVAEVPLVFFEDELARQVSLDYFNRSTHYGTAEIQGWGLYPFEQRMLERFFPAPPARILIHACGGGRELSVLKRLGYLLEAYEPAARLASSAETYLASVGLGPLAVRCLDLQTWSRDPSGLFDGAWIGWSGWAYVLTHDDRVSSLRALARAVPRGPILMSFFRGDAVFDHKELDARPRPLFGSPADRVQRLTRRALRGWLLRASALERGTTWERGFYCHLTEEWELREEAALAGCEVLYYEQDAARCPHAVLRALPDTIR